ncbi:MAG: hypothetical protein IBJ10_07205 [Phycisphaerales bacterium]|nr:hypothetical protein [Phycisphaerales bacterium]
MPTGDRTWTPIMQVPRRVLFGCAMVALSVFVFQLTLFLPMAIASSSAGVFHILFTSAAPLMAGFACLAYGVAQVALGCIDYAKRERD